eukprot:TRINITY_DN737_c0_g1_i1.p1 TRINITY_DN737_c0_g1~~TRINITY_DN737_c0_g1_i1.p1  ORF type:complete len:194 (+),score=10.20 TRINITY_DN737_c0_g1_i1:101-682(+)
MGANSAKAGEKAQQPSPPITTTTSGAAYDGVFDCILLGNDGVGKTSLLLRLTQNTFGGVHNNVPKEFEHTITIRDREVKLCLKDPLPREDRFRIAPVPRYVAHIIFIVFDVSDPSSFNSTGTWFQEVNRFTSNDPIVVLIGNKCDLELKADLAQVEEFSEEYGITFFRTSAKDGPGLNDAIEQAIEQSVKRNS